MGDPLRVAESQLALAEAALMAGDARRALENARQAQTFFAGKDCLNAAGERRYWLDLPIRSFADRLMSETCFKNAGDGLSSLANKSGAENFQGLQ